MWNQNISYFRHKWKSFFSKYCFWFTKYVQASHSFVYHKIFCLKWHFQICQEETWASCDYSRKIIRKFANQIQEGSCWHKIYHNFQGRTFNNIVYESKCFNKNATHKHKRKILSLVMNIALENKHSKKRKL